MLAPCASCGKRVSDRAPVCPFCKTPRVAASVAPVTAEPASLAAPTREPADPAPIAAPPSVLALPKFQRGDFIGDKIQVIDILGEGGFGIVYLVASLDSQSTHALKTLRGELLRDPKTREMFRKEAQIWIDLGPHPNLVRANWITEISGRLYIGMQYVQSRGGRPNSLEGYLEKRPPSLTQSLLWSIQFCHGMEYAVSRGIRCHRDIKPANILIGSDDAVRISDFGIAGLALLPEAASTQAAPKGPLEAGRTVAGSVFGTPTHMSPEQFEDAASCDERSDVYSFGVVLYQMAASGGLPFLPKAPPPGIDPMVWYWHQFHAMHQDAPPPPLASPLFPAIERCLAKSPSDRYASFQSLRADLEALYRKESGHEPPAPPRSEENASDLQNRAISLGELGRHTDALEVLDRALAKTPNEASLWNNKGDALRSLRRIDEALACLDKAIGLDSLFAAPWVNKGLIYADVQRNDEALLCFDRCLGLSPRNLAAWIGKAVVLGRLGQTGDELACLEKAVEIDPRSSIAWFNMGNLLSTAERPSEALQAYDRALASDPRYAAAWAGRAIVLGEMGRPGDAVAAFDEALRVAPGNGQTWYNKGNVLVQNGRLEDARGCYEQATRLAPEFPLGWYNRALADYQLGRQQDAAAGFGEFLKRAPQHPFAAEAGRLRQLIAEGKAPALRTTMGERAEWQEKAADAASVPDLVIRRVAPAATKPAEPRAAVPALTTKTQSFPLPRPRPDGTVASWNDRCTALFAKQAFSEALAATDKALVLDPRNATALNNRGSCLFRLDRRDEALAALQRAIEIEPASGMFWINQGAMQSLLGKKPEAARSFTEVLELTAGSSEQIALNWAKQARQELAKLPGVRPAPRGYQGWLGAAYQAMVDGKHAHALTCLDNATRLEPQSPEVWRWRGDALGEMKRFEEALQNYDQGLGRTPKNARLWHDKGKTYVKMRLHNEAIEAFDRSIELDPEYAGAWSDRGKMLGVLKRREEAADSLARAVLLAPHHPAPWQNKALLEEELGREADALQSYREFLKRATSDMRLQVEHAKARIPHLEARVRAAGGDVSAPRVAAASLPAPPRPGPGLPPELAGLLGDDFWEGIAPEDVAALRAAAGDPAALGKQIDAMVERAVQGAGPPAQPVPAPDLLPSLAPGTLAGQALPSMAAPFSLKPRTGNPIAKKYAEQGLAALQAGKPAEALALFDKATERDGGEPLYWNNRGLALSKASREAEAISSYDLALALDPKFVPALNNKASLWQRQGRHLDALVLFGHAAAADPGNAAIWVNRGQVLNQLERFSEAEGSFTMAMGLSQQKKDPLAWSGLGEALVRQGRAEEALPVLDQALALEARSADAWYQKGNALGKLGKTADAVECYQRCVEIDPRRANAWYNLGHDLVQLKRYEDALMPLERAIALHPGFDRAFHSKGMALDELGRFEEALQAYDGCLRLDPKHLGALNNRGLALRKLNRLEEALASFERGLAIDGTTLTALYDRADTLDKLGRADQAIPAYETFLAASRGEKKALEQVTRARLRVLKGEPEPNAAAPTAGIPAAQVPKVIPGAPFPDCLKRGEVSLNQGQAEKALAWYQQAIVGDPRSYQAWAGAAESYLALKKHLECVSHFDKALELNPRYVIGWQRRSKALEALDRHEAALLSWDKGLELAPQNLQLWNGRGLALFYLGRHEEAIQSFDKALAIDPRFSLAKFNKAHCQDRLARSDEAVKSFQQFLALAPPHLSAQIQEARKRVQELKSG